MADRPPEHHRPSDDELLAWARDGEQALEAADPDHVAGLWDGIAEQAFGDADQSHEPAPPAHPAPVGDLAAARARRRPSWPIGLAAAAVAVLVLGGVVWTSVQPPDAVPVASFRMDPLAEDAPAGVSGVIVERDGRRSVDVDFSALPTSREDAFYELWLLDLEAGELVSLGPVGDTASYVVPPAIDVGSYPTIDVSIEPVDGDPTHSGDSVLRGPISPRDGGA